MKKPPTGGFFNCLNKWNGIRIRPSIAACPGERRLPTGAPRDNFLPREQKRAPPGSPAVRTLAWRQRRVALLGQSAPPVPRRGNLRLARWHGIFPLAVTSADRTR